MTVQKIRKMKLTLFLISFLMLSGFLVALFQNNIIKIKADTWSIAVSVDHLAFGTVFPGEQLQKNLTVLYSGSGDGSYTITEKYKPLPDAEIPADYQGGDISDYCQEHPDDLERCYRDLCPYIIEYSEEDEGDTVNGASVSADDISDLWIVHLDSPAIAGEISQDHTGGIISTSGDYGCDLSFEVNVFPKGSISGCKYNDANNNGLIDEGEEKLSDWEIQLIGCSYPPLAEGTLELLPISRINENPEQGETGYCSVVQTTVTNSEGCYTFTDLEKGDYGVNEVAQENWTQTYPADNKFYYFTLDLGEDKTTIDFANFNTYQKPYCGDGNLDPGEQCDDGNNINGDGCSADCKNEGGGGGGGGGGAVIISLQINDAKDCVLAEDGTYFSWRTNMASSSRVVCDTEPNPNWGTPPDYGYFFFTDEYNLSPKVLNHEVKISGLVPGENYYCRVISSNSSSTVFEEVICSIPEEEEEEEKEEEIEEEGEVKGTSTIIPSGLPRTGYQCS
ncbi:MAG: SdrD B-like domain-containing protein [Patescibacteria group bacterium]|nr:SdrD B-like domain-containing protein [Patescibacteria group bacterium]